MATKTLRVSLVDLGLDPIGAGSPVSGTVWARYGLRVAQASLTASSQTLTTTARALGNLAEAFQKEQPAEAPIVTDAEEAKEA